MTVQDTRSPAGPSGSVRFVVEAAEGAALSGWVPIAYALTEEVHAPWACHLELVAEASGHDTDPTTLLDRELTVRLSQGSHARVWRGVVTEVASAVSPEEGAAGHRRAHLKLVSRLALLAHETDGRVFQDKGLESIARTVCRRVGIAANRVASQTAVDYGARGYRVQWHEDSLHFLLRVTAEEGVTVRVDAAAEGDRVHLCDLPATWPCTAESSDPVVVFASDGAAQGHTGITSLTWRTGRKPRPVYLRDHDWTRPKYAVSGPRDDGPGRIENSMLFDYPASVSFTGYNDDVSERRFTADNLGRLVTARGEMHLGATLHGQGRGNCLRIEAGRRVWVREGSEAARETMMLRVVHRGWLRHEGVAHDTQRPEYENEFELMPTRAPGEGGREGPALPFRPARRTPPRVAGVLRGTVARPVATVEASISPDGGGVNDEIWTDKHGRVLVRFHWDQSDHDEDQKQTSCWVRVMRPWAGGDLGFVFTPRVGTEVLVGFEDGDPDRPIVLGGLHDGTHRPPNHNDPHTVEAERTRSVIRTRSTPGGTGFNELSFEDLAAREEVFLRAQRNLRELVLNDRLTNIHHDEQTHVGHDSSLTVAHDRYKKVGNDEEVHILHDRKSTVCGDEVSMVQGHQWTTVGKGDARAVMPGGAGEQGVCIDVKRNTFVGTDDALTVGRSFMLNHHGNNAFVLLDRDSIRMVASKCIEFMVGESRLIISPDAIQFESGGAKVRIGEKGKGHVWVEAEGGGHLEVIRDAVELNC